MKKRIITGTFIFLVTALCVLAKLLPHDIGAYIFDVFALAVVIVAGFEMSEIMNKGGKNVNKFLTSMYGIFYYIVLLICLKVADFNDIIWIEMLALIAYGIVTFLVEWIKAPKGSLKEHFNVAVNTLIACLYPSFMFCLILNINHMDYFVGIRNFSLMFVVMVFAISMLTDTLALFVGCALKGPKLAPSISPKKTISGACGGLIGGMLGAMLVFLVIKNVSGLATMLSQYGLAWWHFLLIGLLGSVIGQAGDLFESKLKRKVNIKDSGNLFPGHGGMMDRVDSIIFVVVFLTICLTIITM
ncbi:MAG: hypothetical protein E7374_02685 [Clostridiales bacterium]|nr:hypothetical protein [Clostridiales bacterium]